MTQDSVAFPRMANLISAELKEPSASQTRRMNQEIETQSKRPLRTIFVEDSEDDYQLILRELRRGGFDVTHTRLESAEAFRDALSRSTWDLILCDYSMPRFSAPAAIAILKESGLDIPLIVISGTIGEETAVEALKVGASDFLVKGKLARLIPAIERELDDAGVRRAQRKAEERHRASEERFRAVTESASDSVVSVDNDGTIVYINPAAEKMFGFAVAEIHGQPLTRILPERFHEHFQQAQRLGLLNYFLSQDVAPIGRTLECFARRRDGSEFPIDVSLAKWMSEKHVYYTGIIRDVTDRKKIEAQLMVSDRMASLGSLAAGVAHEINNPLAMVLANMSLAALELDKISQRIGAAELRELQEELREAIIGATRVRDIVRDLKIFSRGAEETHEAVDVHQAMDSSLRMAWNEIRHRAILIKNYKPVPPVVASESKLGQVFLNLVVNAAQSIPEGQAYKNEIHIAISASPDGRRVEVEIRDTGSGMSSAVIKRLFTPFFTTKPVGVGTGLGLSICQRIVAGFAGEITVESQVGKGSTFRVLLPAAQSTVTTVSKNSPSARSCPRRGKILVVDDEPSIAIAVRRILSREHDVETTSDPLAALERIKAGQRFDAILCDLMMPQMTGMDLHSHISQLAPEQAGRMVFLTGGAFTPKARAFLDANSNRRIEKPFDFDSLRAAVNEQVS